MERKDREFRESLDREKKEWEHKMNRISTDFDRLKTEKEKLDADFV